jgi:hypothetical protein
MCTLDDSNHIRYFKYHKIPIVGKILKPISTSVNVPTFSDDEIGLIVDEEDITIYQGNNASFDLKFPPISANIIIILISKKPKSLFVILTLAVKSKSAFGVNITASCSS